MPGVSLLFAESSFEAVHGDLALDDFRRAVDDESEDRQDVQSRETYREVSDIKGLFRCFNHGKAKEVVAHLQNSSVSKDLQIALARLFEGISHEHDD